MGCYNHYKIVPWEITPKQALLNQLSGNFDVPTDQSNAMLAALCLSPLVFLWRVTVRPVPMCRSCHKSNMVITGRAHVFV